MAISTGRRGFRYHLVNQTTVDGLEVEILRPLTIRRSASAIPASPRRRCSLRTSRCVPP
ncbi:MAG: hypothetical protein CM15mP74_19280 [Halieaceae bacterium]|nr:MAG: hypothetical protein CM15mP74_19280 [Halieaceae bacterium]